MTLPGLIVREGGLGSPQVVELLRFHVADMQAGAPPGLSFTLDLAALNAPEVTVWTAWDDDAVAGIAALKLLDARTAEVKSMRTHPAHLRKGVGALLLAQIIRAAKERGLARLSLETGVGPAFEPALALYRKHGFRPGPAFADYPTDSAFNQYLHLDLLER